jgi:putative transposase
MPHRKTCKRYNDPGHAHALTFSCFRRQSFLSSERSRQWLIDAIDRSRSKYGFHLWAYVIMPEHVHLLIWPTTEDYDISNILSAIKQSVAKRAVPFVRSSEPAFLSRMVDCQPNGAIHHRFWQPGGGYDRNLTEAETVEHEMNYIHNNPVKRGLCSRPEDWFWSSAADYAGVRVGPIRIDRESLPRLSGGV